MKNFIISFLYGCITFFILTYFDIIKLVKGLQTYQENPEVFIAMAFFSIIFAIVVNRTSDKIKRDREIKELKRRITQCEEQNQILIEQIKLSIETQKKEN